MFVFEVSNAEDLSHFCVEVCKLDERDKARSPEKASGARPLQI